MSVVVDFMFSLHIIGKFGCDIGPCFLLSSFFLNIILALVSPSTVSILLSFL